MDRVLGIVGGSGLYDLEEMTNKEWRSVSTPFGDPSDQILVGEIQGQAVAFLPRHGRGHRVAPSQINYRANVFALKSIGVTDILSVSAVGSLKEKLSPGTFVLVDQFIDRTFAREKSFFGDGLVAHVPMADPICGDLNTTAAAQCDALEIKHSVGGTYLAMEGPQFSTRAESHLYRSWGCDVIGMTNMPEAKLAREAEICYLTLAMVTDYDCWRSSDADVSIPEILATMKKNAENAQRLVVSMAKALSAKGTACASGCNQALEYALITAPEARDPELVGALQPIIGRFG
jgi:5'-methylthioadenosine phosphorylase